MTWVERARRALKAAGYRNSGARDAVIAVLDRERGGLSAQEVADLAREGPRRVGTATVYRTLGLLDELGLVRRLDVGRGAARYELVLPGGEHRHHLVCTMCGRTDLFDDPELERVIRRLERSVPYAAQGHDVILRGTCPRCRSRRTARAARPRARRPRTRPAPPRGGSPARAPRRGTA
jgi:Fur family transcriptional regulator, ferric uptake regulator